MTARDPAAVVREALTLGGTHERPKSIAALDELVARAVRAEETLREIVTAGDNNHGDDWYVVDLARAYFAAKGET